jgi:hypothetical protein
MKHSELQHWLLKHNCFLRATDDKSTITHISLDGGRLRIPNELINEFIELYTRGLTVHKDMFFLCERPTNPTKMYCDFDFLESQPEIPTDTVVEICYYLHEVVEYYFLDLEFIVLSAPVKTIVKPEQGKLYKSGYHFIWPELVVDIPTAHALAQQFIKVLKSKIPGYTWDKIIDLQVYTSGLRMIGSCKIVNKKNQIQIENRPYTYNFTYPLSEDTPTTEPTLQELCSLTSIRVLNSEQVQVFEPSQPLVITAAEMVNATKKTKKTSTPQKKANTVKRRLKRDLRLNETLEADQDDYWLYGSIRTNLDKENGCEIIDLIIDYISQHVIQQWRKYIRAIDLVVFDPQKKCYVVQPKTGKYCLNLGRDHNSNRIYFEFYRSGMYQRCHCDCPDTDNRRTGKACGKFVSQPFSLPFATVAQLFPEITFKKYLQEVNKNYKKKNKASVVSSRVGVYPTNLDLKQKQTVNRWLEMSMSTIKQLQDEIKNLRVNGHQD